MNSDTPQEIHETIKRIQAWDYYPDDHRVLAMRTEVAISLADETERLLAELDRVRGLLAAAEAERDEALDDQSWRE